MWAAIVAAAQHWMQMQMQMYVDAVKAVRDFAMREDIRHYTSVVGEYTSIETAMKEM